jgi:LPXTG-motif cell wall-anchored protein
VRFGLLVAAVVTTAGLFPSAGPSALYKAAEAATPPPTIHHVWVINLENEGFASAFGGHANPYLSSTLPAMGQLLTQYYGIGHVSLDNYVAEISGQGPNAITQTDCLRYMDVVPGVLVGGQALGQGCVYPASTLTVANQLAAKGFTWKAYAEDMGNNKARDNTDAQGSCGHPLPNSTDGTQSATATDQYATRHNPFVYFHSIIDTPACHADVIGLGSLTSDLAAESTTPNFSFVTPNLCNDGHDSPCTGTNVRGTQAGGLTAADYWLAKYVPLIVGAPAFKHDGLLAIIFDEAGTSDASACCGETPGINTALPGLAGPGGGRTGAVVVSPFTRPGSTNATPYNHYSLLRSVEDLFGLSHLGMAGAAGLAAFGPDVFNAPPPPPVVAPTPPPSGGPTPTPPTPAKGVLPATGDTKTVALLGMVAAGSAAALTVLRRRRAPRT